MSSICRHCERRIVQQADGLWIDPEAPATPEDGDDHIWREVCDANSTFDANHEPQEHPMDVIHTDAPLIPLTKMVGHHAYIHVDTANAGTEGACFYGWGEARDSKDCPPHHLVSVADDDYLTVIADALVAAGHQVVISNYEVWSENQVVLRYDDHHSH